MAILYPQDFHLLVFIVLGHLSSPYTIMCVTVMHTTLHICILCYVHVVMQKTRSETLCEVDIHSVDRWGCTLYICVLVAKFRGLFATQKLHNRKV